MHSHELQARGIDELVKVTLDLRATLSSDTFLWYRGADCARHKLLPKLMREGRNSDEVFDREKRLLTRFRQRSVAYWPAGYPQDDWEHLFAMQHHGLPTRLLDWSENLFVATYFALASEPRHTTYHDGACEPVLWILDPVQWNKTMPGLSEFADIVQVLTTADEQLDPYRPDTSKRRPRSPVSIYGTHNSKRIVAQRGTFVVWGSEVKALDDFGQSNLWKVVLKGNRDDLFRDLHSLGFTETMIFPELMYLAAELDRAEGWR